VNQYGEDLAYVAPLDGFGPHDNLTVSEIWDSREQFEAWGEKLMPVLAEAGIEFSGEPEVFEIHNVMRR
jgi:hypothetical protein